MTDGRQFVALRDTCILPPGHVPTAHAMVQRVVHPYASSFVLFWSIPEELARYWDSFLQP